MERLDKLQLKMLRVQQGVWHQKKRAIIVFEGFDASGKGGAIRRLVSTLDPRSYRVHAIGPPSREELRFPYLQRFWERVPAPGTVAIFDRSWYGRVLVERVEELTPKERWKAAYKEILEFESVLKKDGIDIIKIFLAISKEEQLRRFEQRLRDPYKQWKLTKDDVEARSKWPLYVDAVEEMFRRTSTKDLPWHRVDADDKNKARMEVLSIVTQQLETHGHWVEEKAQSKRIQSLEAALRELDTKKNE